MVLVLRGVGGTPLGPPVNGGKLPGDPVQAGVAAEGTNSQLGTANSARSPLMRRAGERTTSPHSSREYNQAILLPIECLTPGHCVVGHDGPALSVLRGISREYRGMMVGVFTRQPHRALWVTADHYVLCAKRTTDYGGSRSWRHVPQQHFERARDMRRETTSAERVLWKAMRMGQLGKGFRRQHPIGPYIADFYSWGAGLVVEVDGDSHFDSEAKEYDQERTKYLEGLGLTVLRFTNIEVLRDLPRVMETVLAALRSVRPADSHYREWRRADSLRVYDVVFGPATDSHASRSASSFTGCLLPNRFPAPGTRPTNPPNKLPPVDGGIEGGDFALLPTEISRLVSKETFETVYDLELQGGRSFMTEVCAVHNLCCGTTGWTA